MKLAKFLNSLEAIQTPMMMLIFGFWIEASVLFFKAFDGVLHVVLQYPASVFFGFAVALPLLLTSINSPILPGIHFGTKKIGFPELFGVYTFIMVLMVFDVLGAVDKPNSWYALILFLAIFLGLIDYLYAHLYVAKFRQISTDWKANWFSLARKAINYRIKIKQITAALTEAQNALTEAQRELTEYRQSLTCPHCGHLPESKSYSALRNHVNRCAHNPKNQ